MELTSYFMMYSGPFKASFEALVPDGKWEKSNGFNRTNYANGGALNNIPRMGTPMDWYIAVQWFSGETHPNPNDPIDISNRPDISNLVQRRVSDESYDPSDPNKKYFGLRCAFVDSYGNTYTLRKVCAYPDNGSARLYVEWDDPPAYTPRGESFGALDFEINHYVDDTFIIWGPTPRNGNYYDGSRNFNGPEEPPVPINFQLDLDCARWRWKLDGIPRGAYIDEAKLIVKTYDASPSREVGFSFLVPDGVWNVWGFAAYGEYLLPNGIPGHGRVTQAVPAWGAGIPDYELPHDLSDLVEEFVASTWDDEYDVYFGELEGRHYEYKEGDYFALGCDIGGWPKLVYQDPDHDPARLHVHWASREYYSATYYMKEGPKEDTYTDAAGNNNPNNNPLQVGGGNKGYWKFGLSIPQYAVIQKATLIYTLPESIELVDPVFYTLYASDGKWNKSGGFVDKIVRDKNHVVPDLDHYPNAASLDAIWRNLNAQVDVEGSVDITNDPNTSIDITELVQAYIDCSHIQFGDYFGLVLESATNTATIPKGSLAVHVEWMLLFKN